jgi:AraC-like DNA-binding protein
MRTLYFAPEVAAPPKSSVFVLGISPLFRELILHACTVRAWRVAKPKERRVIDLLLDLVADAPTIPLTLPEPRDPRAAKVAARLIADPSDSRTLADLAKGSGAAARTIERAFVADTGMTFGKWRQQLRLLHGMRRLAAGAKVLAAAVDAGYDSPSAFTQAFKKAFGDTPAQYFKAQ